MAEQKVKSEIVKAFGIADGPVATEAEILEMVMDAWKDGIERRRPFEKDWMHNIMFAAGHQWLEWDGMDARWRLRDRVPEERIRLVENRTRRLLEAAIALLVGHRPKWDVLAATKDQKDRVKAEVAGRVLDGAWEVYALDELTESMVDWQLTCGMVGVKTYWDEDTGPLVPVGEVDEAGKDVVDEVGNPVTRKDKKGREVLVPQGDVRSIIIPPFLIIPDPTATRPWDLGWVIHHPWRSKSYIEERWPEKVKEIPLDSKPADDWSDAKLRDYYSSKGIRRTEAPEGKKWCQGAYIAEMIIRPGRKYPRGAMIHVAISSKDGSGTFLDWVDELDEDLQRTAFLPGHTGLGIEFAGCFRVPGRFWPMSFVDLLAPMNKALNKVQSDILEIENQHSKPKWLAPRNANLAEGALHQGSGEVVEYTWPFEPKQSQPPQMPMYVIDFVKSQPVRMQEIAGIHQATLGQTPGDMRSGVAISLVQEQDERGFTRPNREKERLLSRIGRRTLALMRANFDKKRMVHLAGDETAPWDMAELEGADLTTFIDVRVKEGSTTRRNVAAQRSNILELLQSAAAPALTQLAPMQQGVVLSRILTAMDLGDLGVLYDQTGLDSQNARYEQKMMERGVDMPLTPEENPLVHLQVHGDDIKSATTQGGDDVALARKRKHFQMTQQYATLLMGGPPTAPGAPGGGEPEKKGTAGPAKAQKPPVG